MKDERVAIVIHLPPNFAEKIALSARRSGRSRKSEIELRLMDHLLRYKPSNKNIITKNGVEFEAIENDD